MSNQILLPAFHKINVFQMRLFTIFPGIAYFYTRNKVERKSFQGAPAIFCLILTVFFIIYFKPMVVGRQTQNKIWNWNPNIWLNKMVTFWTIFHKGVRKAISPRHYGMCYVASVIYKCGANNQISIQKYSTLQPSSS